MRPQKLKNLVTGKLFPVLFFLLLACGEEQVEPKAESPPEMLIDSSVFRSLNVDQTQLNLTAAIVKETSIGTKSVLIPMKNDLSYVYGEGKINKLNKLDFSEVVLFQYNTQLNYDQLALALKNSNFSGELKIKSSRNYSLFLVVSDNKFVGTKELKWNKVQTCSGTPGSNQWVQDVANCASQRIANMNWFDTAICYLALPECWAQNVISCVIDECETIAGP